MSEGACAAVSTSTQSDYDLCWKNVIKINLEARQQASCSEVVSSSSNSTLSSLPSSLPSVGYTSLNASANKRLPPPSEVIVVADDSPSSPGSTDLVLNTANMSKPPTSAQLKDASASGDPQNLDALRELLQKEEKKLSVLKTIRGLQDTVTTIKPSSIQGSALNKTSGRTSGSGSGRNSPNMRASQPKHSIVVVPGNQTTSRAAQGSSTSNTGISSRLQQLVDNIAVDQALNSDKLHSSPGTGARGTASGGTKRAAPPVPGLTSLSSTNTHNKHHNYITTTTTLHKPRLVTSSTLNRSPHEVITIADSPMGKNPPPLLSSGSSTASSNGSIHVPTISSAPRTTLPLSNGTDKPYTERKYFNQIRYRDYALKHSHTRKIFNKQIERKLMAAPYPKTFRQVWPLIPVYDSGFVRNFGLEAVSHYFDPTSKALMDKNNSKMKPICNQCCCDFASAWQIRKSNSKQLLLCEACDFQNLKILQRSKLSNQLKELVESVKAEQEKFAAEYEAMRKELEKHASENPPPLTSQIASHLTSNSKTPSPTPGQRVAVKGATGKYQIITSNSGVNLVGKHVHLVQSSQNGAGGGLTAHLAIPSILGQKSDLSQVMSAGGNIDLGNKRPTIVTTGRTASSAVAGPPASKVCKPGSALDQTLNRLSKQLIERKLDEVVVVSVKDEGSEAENSVVDMREAAGPTSPGPAGHKSSKSRRKGTPKHKRLLSASSINSE